MSREFKHYVATTKFTVSLDETTSETIYEGDELEFNGQLAIIGGEQFKMPKLRAAIKAKPPWLVEKSDASTTAAYRPSSAEIEMTKATPQQEDKVSDGTTEISSEERVVNTVNQRDEFLNEGNQKSQDQMNAQRQATAQTEGATSGKGGGRRASTDRKPQTPTVIGDDQDAQDIGVRFKTSANESVDLSKMNDQSLRQKINDLENKPSKSVQEQGEKPQAQSRVEAEGIAFDNHNVGDRSSAGKTASKAMKRATSANPYDGDHTVVGAVGEQPEPVEARRKVRTQAPTPERVEVPSDHLPEEELDDQLDPSVKEARYRIAKIIHPDLPEWDFEAHWTKKMKRIKEEFSDNEIVLRALYASESEAIKKRIKKEFGLGL